VDKQKLKALQISGDVNVKYAMSTLNETGEKVLFVVDAEEKLLGTVTDGDIRRSILAGKGLACLVSEIMRRECVFLTQTPGQPLRTVFEKAKHLLRSHVIGNIPLVSARGTIIDVITWFDCLEEDSGEAETAPPLPRSNPVVIMAGGKGTRLDPFTRIFPKPLIPVGDKVIIEHIMDKFKGWGFSRFKLIVNYKKEMLKLYFNDNGQNYDVEFFEEPDYLGTAGGLFLLREALGETFIVTNCDTILEGDAAGFFDWHQEKGNMITIVGSHKEIIVPYGVLTMSNGSLLNIDEKPKIDLFINTGTYVFEPEVFELVDNNRHLDMDRLIQLGIAAFGDKVSVYPHWDGWHDIGQWDEYGRSLKCMGISLDEI
jgi:dTDP-glucose pyrophosphorylase